MSNKNLYYRTHLDEKITLRAEQINGNMDQLLLENLKKKWKEKFVQMV